MRWIIIDQPQADFELTEGLCRFHDGPLGIGDRRITVAAGRGTLATACLAASFFAINRRSPAHGASGGDGSEALWLLDERILNSMRSCSLHYLQPDVDWHNRFSEDRELVPHPAFRRCRYMYVAKMSGFASRYDPLLLMREMAFLADRRLLTLTPGFCSRRRTSTELIAGLMRENAARPAGERCLRLCRA